LVNALLPHLIHIVSSSKLHSDLRRRYITPQRRERSKTVESCRSY
jgi:hypothetical protein